jgi:3-hydroxyacyl-CoA dehydrogenase/enoyl-CoA hydratase/3-hydroxybutyryl-CoA epimerase
LERALARAEQLAAEYGERFAPPQRLRQHAQSGLPIAA